MVAAGAAATAGLAAFGARIAGPSWVVVWIVLVPWLLSLEQVRTSRGALGAGVLMSVLFTLAVLGWFAGAIASYTGMSRTGAVLVLVLIAPLLQLQLVVLAVARMLLRRRGAGRARVALVSASTYVGIEWASGKLFGDTLAHGLFPSPWLRQAADLAGTGALTLLIVLANECVLAAVVGAAGVRAAPSRGRRPALGGMLAPAGAFLALVTALALYGRVRLRALEQGELEAELEIAAIQAGMSGYEQLRSDLGTYDATRLILDTHFAMSTRALAEYPGTDLLVWPETVYPTTYGKPKSEAGAELDREIEDFVAALGVPLVFGTYDRDRHREYNSAALLAPSAGRGARAATYRKQRLFPLTERAPALLDNAAVRGLLPWLGTWRPGTGPAVIDAPLASGGSLRLAPLVCYDAVDPDLSFAAARAGAELLLVLSNDSWFAHGAGPHQHLVVSAFRSIETRLPQVRATNTGISAWIEPTGEIRSTLSLGARGALVAAVSRESLGWTWATYLGPWVGPGALLLALITLLPSRSSSLRT